MTLNTHLHWSSVSLLLNITSQTISVQSSTMLVRASGMPTLANYRTRVKPITQFLLTDFFQKVNLLRDLKSLRHPLCTCANAKCAPPHPCLQTPLCPFPTHPLFTFSFGLSLQRNVQWLFLLIVYSAHKEYEVIAKWEEEGIWEISHLVWRTLCNCRIIFFPSPPSRVN